MKPLPSRQRTVPGAAEKRPRGRPRKPDPFDWVSNPPPHIREWNIEPNITEEMHRQYKFYCEENRREKVGDAVRGAYSGGRNTANIARKTEKLRRIVAIHRDNEDLIFKSSLSDAAVAGRIIAQGKNHGLRDRALRAAVATIRKVGKAK